MPEEKQHPLTPEQVRAVGRRILARANLMQQEALSARASRASRAAQFLEGIAQGLRDEALLLLRGFPSSGDHPLGDDDPTNPQGGTPPAAA